MKPQQAFFSPYSDYNYNYREIVFSNKHSGSRIPGCLKPGFIWMHAYTVHLSNHPQLLSLASPSDTGHVPIVCAWHIPLVHCGFVVSVLNNGNSEVLE